MTDIGAFSFQWRGDTPWLVLVGDVDIESVEPVTDAVLGAYETSGVLVADVRGVTFIDSLGIGLLLRLRQIATAVRLVEPPHEVMRVLELCGVASLFEIEAVAA